MKVNKLSLVIALALLAFTSTAFASGKLALTPQQATLPAAGPDSSVTLDAFCSQAPCNLKWFVIASNSKVGHIDLTSGPQTHFIADGAQGTAIVVVQDEAGNLEFSKITVQKAVALR